MGQTLSAPTLVAEADGWPSPAPEGSPLPSQLPPHNTTVLDTGHLSEETPCTWHVQGGHLRFPIPQGFQATCEIFGQKLHLSVEPNEPKFKLQTENGEIYTGATPTAPFAKWTLSSGRLEIPNGLEAYGFTNIEVQAILRGIAAPTGKVDALVAQLEPGTAVGAWARPPEGTTPTSGGGGGGGKARTTSLVEHIQQEIQRVSNAQRSPSLAPSLHNWLSVGAPTEIAAAATATAATAAPKSPSSRAPKRPAPQSPLEAHLTEGKAPTTTPFSAPNIQHAGLPPRPSSRAPAPPFAPVPSPEAHAAVLVNRPASRSRSGAMSSGRGWTAFTAFGLQTRDAIREANPFASATEIEKMVGRQWAALTPEGKQHYANVAAEVRRSSQGNLGAMGSGELRAEVLGLGPIVGGGAELGGGAAAAGQQNQQNHPNLLTRTRSDAASAEERQLRPARRPKLYGPEFDTSDAPLPGRKGSSWEAEIDRVYTDILDVQENERVAAEKAAAKAAKDARAKQKRRGAKKQQLLQEKEEAEADVLGVLADMRAEVLASESKESVEEKSAGAGHGVVGDTTIEHGAAAPAASEKRVGGMNGTGIDVNGKNEQEAVSAHPDVVGQLLVQEEQ